MSVCIPGAWACDQSGHGCEQALGQSTHLQLLLLHTGQDLQAQVQPLLPAYNYLCDVIQKGTAALLKVTVASAVAGVLFVTCIMAVRYV